MKFREIIGSVFLLLMMYAIMVIMFSMGGTPFYG